MTIFKRSNKGMLCFKCYGDWIEWWVLSQGKQECFHQDREKASKTFRRL